MDTVRKAVDDEKLEGVILAACSPRAKQQELQLDRAATMVERSFAKTDCRSGRMAENNCRVVDAHQFLSARYY